MLMKQSEQEIEQQKLDQFIQLSEFNRKSKHFPEFEQELYTGVKNKIRDLLLSEYNICENKTEQSAMLLAISPALIEFSIGVQNG